MVMKLIETVRELCFRQRRQPNANEISEELTKLNDAEKLLVHTAINQMVDDLRELLGDTDITMERRMKLTGQLAGSYNIGRAIAGERFQLNIILAQLLESESHPQEGE